MNTQRFNKMSEDVLASKLVNLLLDQGTNEIKLSINDEDIVVDWFQKESVDSRRFEILDDNHEIVKKIFLPDGSVVLAQEYVNEDDVIKEWEMQQQQLAQQQVEDADVEEESEPEETKENNEEEVDE